MNEESISKNIQKIREERQMTQLEMAEELGMSRNNYRNIEKGKTRMVSQTVTKIAELAGISPEEVLLGYIPSDDKNGTLRDIREKYNDKMLATQAEYEAKLERMRAENTRLRDLLAEKDDNIRNLKSMLAFMQNSSRDTEK